MNKQLIIVSLLTFIGLTNLVNAQTPVWQWAKSAGGVSASDVSNAVAVDAGGNSYVTGTFASASITFGSTTLANTGGYEVFVVKYNSAGTVVWAKAGGGSTLDIGLSIAVDASGNCYVSGSFRGTTITFGNFTVTNAGGDDVFIVKYDATGNEVWAKSAGGTSDDYGYGISVDANGNSYITGRFDSSVISFGTTTLSNAGMFVVKYNTSGNVVWAREGSGVSDGRGIAVDGAGNSYVTGFFEGPTLTLGSNTFNNTGNGKDVFIVKYNTSGSIIWAKTAGGNSSDYGMSIAIDGSGNSYIAGYFDSPNLTFGSTVMYADGLDMFVAKYSSNGNPLWAHFAGGAASEYGLGIGADANGNSYVTGYFESTSITFGTTVLTNAGYSDIFTVKYDAAGNVGWATSVGGNLMDTGNGIATESNGTSYITGSFFNSATFGSTILYANGDDMYIAKLASVAGIEETGGNEYFSIAPNPFTYQTIISFKKEQKNTAIKITDLLGKEVKTQTCNGKQCIIERGEMSKGIYFVQLVDEKQNQINEKVVIQ